MAAVHRANAVCEALLQLHNHAVPRSAVEALVHGNTLPDLPTILDRLSLESWLSRMRDERAGGFPQFLGFLETQLSPQCRSVGEPPIHMLETIEEQTRARRWNQLSETCSELLRDYPNSVRALLGVCTGTLEAGANHSEARQAHSAAKRAAKLRPDSKAAWSAVTRAARSVGDKKLVVEALRGKVRASPVDVGLRYAYARALRGYDKAESVRQFEEILDQDPTHERARFKLAILKGASDGIIPDKVPRDTVVKLYQSYAEVFDEHLQGKLEYSTPETMVKAVVQAAVERGVPEPHWGRCADLGCGTGLSGMAFAQVVDVLEGVDLSSAMVAKAEERGIYNELVVGDVVEFLEARIDYQYEMVIACDVLVYIGDLGPVAAASYGALKPGGVMAFSTEKMDGEDEPVYTLRSSNRFAHNELYLRKLAKDHHFEIDLLEASLIRKNKGKPIWGNICVMRKIA